MLLLVYSFKECNLFESFVWWVVGGGTYELVTYSIVLQRQWAPSSDRFVAHMYNALSACSFLFHWMESPGKRNSDRTSYKSEMPIFNDLSTGALRRRERSDDI